MVHVLIKNTSTLEMDLGAFLNIMTTNEKERQNEKIVALNTPWEGHLL